MASKSKFPSKRKPYRHSSTFYRKLRLQLNDVRGKSDISLNYNGDKKIITDYFPIGKALLSSVQNSQKTTSQLACRAAETEV